MSNYIRGIDLRLERTALRILAKDLAERAGWPAARVSAIENTDRITERTAQRYREALATLATVTTSEQAG